MERAEALAVDPESGLRQENMRQKMRRVVEKMSWSFGKIVAMFIAGLTVMQPYHAAIAGSRFAIRRFAVPEELSSIYVSKYHTALHTLNMFGVIVVNVYMWFYGSTHLRFNPLLSVFTNFLVSAAHIGLVIAYMVRSERDLTMYYWFSAAGAFISGVNQAFVASVGVEYLSFFVCGLQFTGIGVTLFHSLFMSLAKLAPTLDVDYWIIAVQLMLCASVAVTSLLLWNNYFGQGDLSRMLQGKTIEGDKKDQIPEIDVSRGAGLYIDKEQKVNKRSAGATPRATVPANGRGKARGRVKRKVVFMPRMQGRNPGARNARTARSRSRRARDLRSADVPVTLASTRMESTDDLSMSHGLSREDSLPSTSQHLDGSEFANGEYGEHESTEYPARLAASTSDYYGYDISSLPDGRQTNYGNGGTRYSSGRSTTGRNVGLSVDHAGQGVEIADPGRADRHTVQQPKPNIFISLKIARSPILMSAFSMSMAFFFYPSVAPYKLAELVEAHKIDLSVLVVAAVPTIAVCVLCLIESGPNKRWEGKDQYWHYYWYLALPYLFACVSFAVAMHYPTTRYARFVRNPVALAFLTVGYAGAGMQEGRRNPTISTFNMMFSFLLLFTGVFWGSGYIKLYNRYTPEEWPTRGMSAVKAFVYWAKHSFDAGFTNFTKIVTNDLMRDIMATTPSE
ncbi:conserved hypothetical protein [Theileria orientalis strain Shintoku]|uniref:Uncharacterized protein n=1 Tax=Theileria orientalis strain Shintoku TaxID=869250 RepID=J4D840_THEOR|nr:conserved hypothetical protein [Theileria orientalis strain Shintoku]BAM40550.1 conserved hypothetical protein [Theileria orientalis strain Shintoku]|eukprot:XP_009690851.1 conserved hypothetical protein [Theileria orientalis strain Shintoku]